MGRGSYYSWWRRTADRFEQAVLGTGWSSAAAYNLGLQGKVLADHQEFSHPAIPSGHELRVAFLSDIHAGPLTDQRLIEQAFRIVAQFKPHLTLLGGDYVSIHERYIERLRPLLSELDSPLGVLGVMGNHDLWADDKVIVKSPFERVSIFGLDEPSTGVPDASRFQSKVGDLNILLMHSPLGLGKLGGFAFDVAFCGHTHGGQIALPGGAPVVLPRGSGSRQYASGRKKLPATTSEILTSRGVGMSDLPMRLFAPSEVHLCSFTQG
jgi:uncharacterized protein